MTDAPRAALAGLWKLVGGADEAIETVTFSGSAHVLPSIFDVTTAATASIAGATLAAAELHSHRSGAAVLPPVAVDSLEACVAFLSTNLLHVHGESPPALWDDLAGHYEAADGRWMQLHTNFAHHREAAVRAIDAGQDRADVERAIASRSAFDLEVDIAAEGGVAFVLRSTEEWRSHPQGQVYDDLDVVRLDRLDDAPAERRPGTDGPLSGLRVLDLTRVIAGPVAGRTLAGWGADVLRVGAEHLPVIGAALPDTNLSKRFTNLDLRRAGDAEIFRSLVKQADVVLRGYRPGALDALGFGLEELAALRPGLVVVDVSAFGPVGPWAPRRGFDSLVQTTSGIAHAGMVAADSDRPKPLPCQALDHATGYFAAMLAMRGLTRRMIDGSGWYGQASLAGTGRWLEDLGSIPGGLTQPDLTDAEVAPQMVDVDGADATYAVVAPPGRIGGIDRAWSAPATGATDKPVWLDR